MHADALTPVAIASICGVSSSQVRDWIDRGLLRGWRLPDSRHRRVQVRDLRQFMLAYNIPVEWLDRALARMS